MRKEKLLFIMTGGTIDSRFEPTKDAVITSRKSQIPQYIAHLKLHSDCSYFVACMKDSRELTRADRSRILHAVESAKARQIVICHGTYTMAQTGVYLEQNMKKGSKTVVLTGSMVPVSGFFVSDAPFNLGYAISSVQKLPPGVYICMNGRVFAPSKVEKNISIGRFEWKYLLSSLPTVEGLEKRLGQKRIGWHLSNSDRARICTLREGCKAKLKVKGKEYAVELKNGEYNLYGLEK
jgi:L-asparaginase